MLKKSWNILLLGICTLFILNCLSCRLNQPKASVNETSKELKLRQSIIKEAAKHQGTAYKAAGKTPKGFDCSGYTGYVFKQFDIDLAASSAAQAQEGTEVPLKQAKEGDLIFFGRNGRKGKVMHVGIVSKNTKEGIYMWHSSSSKGVIETNLSTSSYWKAKILYLRRVL